MWITREKLTNELFTRDPRETRAEHNTSEGMYGQKKCVVKYIARDAKERRDQGRINLKWQPFSLE